MPVIVEGDKSKGRNYKYPLVNKASNIGVQGSKLEISKISRNYKGKPKYMEPGSEP